MKDILTEVQKKSIDSNYVRKRLDLIEYTIRYVVNSQRISKVYDTP